MTILERIVEKKKVELKDKKSSTPCSQLTSLPYYEAKTLSLRHQLMTTYRKVGIIAEMKKASPSKGVLLASYQPDELFKSYQKAKVEGISILTDEDFFQGSLSHLLQVRHLTDEIPLLRKDFIIDPYQLHEAKGYGASVVLLIASILEVNQYQELYRLAKELHLEVLTEIHNNHDLEKVLHGFIPEMIGINNRNLNNFVTSIQHSYQLIEQIPPETILISESGIHSAEQIKELGSIGVHGVLVGEHVIKAEDQAAAIYELVGMG